MWFYTFVQTVIFVPSPGLGEDRENNFTKTNVRHVCWFGSQMKGAVEDPALVCYMRTRQDH